MSDPKRNKDGSWSVRIRCGAGQNPQFLLPATDEPAAKKLATRMNAVARLLVRARKTTEAPLVLKKLAAQPTEAGLREVEAFAAALCKGSPAGAQAAASPVTFRQLGEQWTTGALHRQYPDQVKLKRTANDDASKLKKHIYPLLGDKPIASITLDDCLDVMRALPKSASRSRVHVAGTIARLFKLAVFPLRLIERSPLPEGFAPRRPARKAMAWLYPDEDRRLMACIELPLEYRMLWGVLAREGMRASEARALTWADLDLKRGMVKLDRNKTDDPRSWALDAGVQKALDWWREQRADESASQLVFRTPTGEAHDRHELARMLRAQLELIGLKSERPELFTTTDERQRIRVHDLRGTFVTIALANGKSESWIADRTGHRSSAMINRYKRTARSFQELGLGELTALSAAIPEVTVSTGVNTETINNEAKAMKEPNNFQRPQRDSNRAKASLEHAGTEESSTCDTGVDRNEPECSPSFSSGEHRDPAEAALADALRGATAAGRWDVVSQLATELETRRRAREASVVDLASERTKRERGGR